MPRKLERVTGLTDALIHTEDDEILLAGVMFVLLFRMAQFVDIVGQVANTSQKGQISSAP